MLGHADLQTTQINTQVSIRKLKEVHTAWQPAALLRPGRARAEEAGATEANPTL